MRTSVYTCGPSHWQPSEPHASKLVWPSSQPAAPHFDHLLSLMPAPALLSPPPEPSTGLSNATGHLVQMVPPAWNAVSSPSPEPHPAVTTRSPGGALLADSHLPLHPHPGVIRVPVFALQSILLLLLSWSHFHLVPGKARALLWGTLGTQH